MCLKKVKLLFITMGHADWGWLEAILKYIHKKYHITVVNVGVEPIKYGLEYVDKYIKLITSHKITSLVDLYTYLPRRFYDKVDLTDIDTVIVLGDRIEVLAVMPIFYTSKIPVHHLFAGDISGCLDNSYRQAISMLANHLYTITNIAFKRVDRFREVRPPDELRSINRVSFGFDVAESFYAVCGLKKHKYAVTRFHPETKVDESGDVQGWINYVCRKAVKENTTLVVFPSNKDDGWENIKLAWDKAEKEYPELNFLFMDKVLKRREYLGLLKHAKWVAGNSSSFTYETHLVGQKATLLFGNRQYQRDRAFMVCDEAISVVDALIFNIEEDLNNDTAR